MNGFNVNIGTDGIKVLAFECNRPRECIDFALANNIKRLSLFDYSHPSLDLLLPLADFLEGLILNEKVDLGELCRFKKLNYLGALDNKRSILDLNCFPDLKTLACNITERLKGLRSCKNLESLTISQYNPSNTNLSELPSLPSLQHLCLIKTRINTLAGVERFSKLKTLEIYSAPTLKDINSLEGLSHLEEVSFEACKKVVNYDSIGKISSLKKITLTNSGQIPTLSFVKNVPHLKFISFVGTNILDGNIGYCEGIQYVGFDDKRHYSHRMEDFDQLNSTRQS